MRKGGGGEVKEEIQLLFVSQIIAMFNFVLRMKIWYIGSLCGHFSCGPVCVCHTVARAELTVSKSLLSRCASVFFMRMQIQSVQGQNATNRSGKAASRVFAKAERVSLLVRRQAVQMFGGCFGLLGRSGVFRLRLSSDFLIS